MNTCENGLCFGSKMCKNCTVIVSCTTCNFSNQKWCCWCAKRSCRCYSYEGYAVEYGSTRMVWPDGTITDS